MELAVGNLPYPLLGSAKSFGGAEALDSPEFVEPRHRIAVLSIRDLLARSDHTSKASARERRQR